MNLVVAGLFIISCGNQNPQEMEKQAAEMKSNEIAVESSGIDFSLKALDGELITLSDYRGKTVVVNFWATWCKPCLIEMPDLNDLYNERKPELAVIGITLESGEVDQVIPVVSEMNLDYPIVMGDQAVAAVFGDIVAFPTTFIVDASGKITQKYIGTMTRKKLESLVEQAN